VANGQKNSAVITAVPYGGAVINISQNLKRKTVGSVFIAKIYFTAHPVNNENIVDIHVTLIRASERGKIMTTEQFEREKKYRAALAVADNLFRKRIITIEDYEKVEEVLRDKFKPFIGAFVPAD